MDKGSNDSVEEALLVYYYLVVLRHRRTVVPKPLYSKPGVGNAYIKDLLKCGHPERFRSALRMDVRIYGLLKQTIHPYLQRGKSLTLDEKMAIGLDWLGHGSTMRNQCEKFRRAIGKIKESREEFVNAVVKSLGHTMTVTNWSLRHTNDMSIPRDDDYYYAFRGAVGSIDGSHFRLVVPKEDADRYRSRKGYTSTNVQIVCDHYGKIVHVFPGTEGSAHDGFVLRNSLFIQDYMDTLPPDTFLLGDAGYPLLKGRLLVPYRSVRYHLQEFSKVNPPKDKFELFNLRHARLRTTIERVIGILKKRWRVFGVDNSIDCITFSRTIIACCLLHNFLMDNNDDVWGSEEEENENNSVVDLTTSEDERVATNNDEEDGKVWRDAIAQELWEVYECQSDELE